MANSVRPRLVEANQNRKCDEWTAALDKMESLKPRTVVAGSAILQVTQPRMPCYKLQLKFNRVQMKTGTFFSTA